MDYKKLLTMMNSILENISQGETESLEDEIKSLQKKLLRKKKFQKLCRKAIAEYSKPPKPFKLPKRLRRKYAQQLYGAPIVTAPMK